MLQMEFIKRDVLDEVLKKACTNEKVKLLEWRNAEENKIKTAYTSDREILVVEYETETGRQQKSFFLKVPCDTTFERIRPYKYHEKEIYAYEAILSEFEKFIDFRIIPEYYYSDDKYNIILEDLRAKGYRTYKQHEFLDFEHSAKVMQVLATYHALTHKLITTSASLFNNDAVQAHVHNALVVDKETNSTCMKAYHKILRRVDPSFADKYANQLKNFADNLVQNGVKETKPKANSFKVLVHGDFRSGNLMFKYDKYQNLEDIKIIDHQTAYISDPSIDIMNYIMQSVKFEIFDKYFDLLMEIYTNSLNRWLQYLKCDRTYSVDELRNDIKNKYNFWICVMILSVPMGLSDPDNVNKNLLQNDESLFEEKYYMELSKKWFKYFIKTGLEEPTSKVFLAS
ncbi:hypothetical protein PGB90_001724 [Kerria lacca]